MSNVIDINTVASTRRGRARFARRHAGPERTSSRRRLVAAVAVAEVLYILGLIVAVPIGRGAVAGTIALAYLLAVGIGTLLGRERHAHRGP